MAQPVATLAPSMPGTHEEMLARTSAMLPVLAGRATECEQLRKVPRETIGELVEAGLVNLMLPKRWGGSELDYIALYDVVSLVGTTCASTSWVLTNLISCSFMPCYWPGEAQQELWSETADTLLAGSLIFGGGQAARAEDGYTLRGRWPLVSGCDHADWVILGALVEDETTSARFRMFLVPKADYTIHDTWRASGLKGSGSNDVEVREVFIPEHRTLLVDDTKGGDSPGSRVNAGWLYRMPMFGLFSSWVGATVLGIAQGALQDFVGHTRDRVTRIGGQKMAQHSTVQAKTGEAACAIDAAKALVYANVREAQEIARQGGVPTLEQKLQYRAGGAFAADLCLRAVDLLHAVGGAAGLYESNPLARHFRDAHAGTSHITQNLDVNGSLYATHIFGLPADTQLL